MCQGMYGYVLKLDMLRFNQVCIHKNDNSVRLVLTMHDNKGIRFLRDCYCCSHATIGFVHRLAALHRICRLHR